VTVLLLSGIIKVRDGKLKVRNRIYARVFNREWVIENMPDAELRRQRAAYRRGLLVGIASPFAAALISGILVYEYSQLSRMELPEFKPPEPPAFWLSGSLLDPQQARVGALLVKAGDKNVTVFINEQQYGLTTNLGELRIPGLPAGHYKIRAEKPGYQAVTQQANIIEDSETQITFNLLAPSIVGKLVIIGAPPGTSVRVDERYVGTTGDDGAFFMNAAPGDHTVELAKKGFVTKQTKKRFPSIELSRALEGIYRLTCTMGCSALRKFKKSALRAY
jgi:hypothetical protein